jgi:hypothetical protein
VSAECDLRTAPTNTDRSQKGFPHGNVAQTHSYLLPQDAKIIDKDGKPHVRIKEDGKTALYPLTKDRKKYLKPAEKWYAKHRDASGAIKLTPLSPN